MAFQSNAELTNRAVQALADSAPSGWTKIIFYLEFLEDEEIGLRNSFTGRVFGGDKFDIRLDGYQLGRSTESFDSIKDIYLSLSQYDNKWIGIQLTIFSDGLFKCRFYYEKAPLLNDDDDDALEEIMSVGMSDVPSDCSMASR